MPYLSDAGVHAPPSAGSYPYYATFGTFGPNQPGFLAVGGSYVDPIFGNTIRRLTSAVGIESQSEIYAKNGFFNADGTRMHHKTTVHNIIDTTTGATVRAGVSFNADSSFDPVNPDVWYYFDWNVTPGRLLQFSIATGASAILKNFGGGNALGQLGGSVDWIDRSGRYMVLKVGGVHRVWDKQLDILYAGSISGAFGQATGGWVGISPDAQYVVAATAPSDHRSFAIDHVSRSVNTVGTLFWTLSGDHGDLVSATDGHTYLVTNDESGLVNPLPGIYAVDVSLPQTAGNAAQQIAQNRLLIQLADWADTADHFSGVAKAGTFQDWCYVSLEGEDDDFTGPVTPWRPYQAELLMVNVLTGEIRRLAHHRSRGLATAGYFSQPKVNSTWDGLSIAWASNFGLSAALPYGDIYAMDLGTVAAEVPTPLVSVGHRGVMKINRLRRR